MKILKSHHFLWFLKSKQQKNPKSNNTHKKGISTTRMSTAEQGCVGSVSIPPVFTVVSAKDRDSCGCPSSPAWCQKSVPAGRGNVGTGKMLQLLRSFPPQQDFKKQPWCWSTSYRMLWSSPRMREPQKQFGWERPLRSWSQSHDRISPYQPDHGTEWHIQSFL